MITINTKKIMRRCNFYSDDEDDVTEFNDLIDYAETIIQSYIGVDVNKLNDKDTKLYVFAVQEFVYSLFINRGALSDDKPELTPYIKNILFHLSLNGGCING